MKLTVFTSTYNRAELLTRLYNRLADQSSRDFEWLVIDDGSTDETPGLLKKWENDGKIEIHTLKCNNGGRHRAINIGLRHAQGEYFFIIGSDDYMLPDGVETIIEEMDRLEGEDMIGVAFRTIHPDGSPIGPKLPLPRIKSDEIDLRQIRRISGDCSEVFLTSVFRDKFTFPEFEGEKFVPEALIWNRMAESYNLLYIDRAVGVVVYQPGGLSSRIVEIRRNSPRGSMTYYSELTHNPRVPFIRKCRAAINFWRFSRSGAMKEPRTAMIGRQWLWLAPAGALMRFGDILFNR